MDIIERIKRLPFEAMDAEGLDEEQAMLLGAARAFLCADEDEAERLADVVYQHTRDEQMKEAARSLLFALLCWQDRFDELAQYGIPRDEDDGQTIALYGALPKVSMPSQPVELDMPIVIEHLPAVRVKINGVGVTLIIDTGAMISVMNESTARACGVALGGDALDAVVATGDAFRAAAAEIDHLDIGGIELRGKRCIVLADELLDMGDEGMIQGAIGWEVIRLFKWTLDYPARRVRVEASTPRQTERNMCCDFFPMVRIRALGRELCMGMDTGAVRSTLGKSLIPLLPSSEPKLRPMKGAGPEKQVHAVEFGKLALRIGQTETSTLETYALADEEYSHSAFFVLPGDLGSDIARDGALVVDWPNRHLSILPVD